jgi:hypothetical protein
MKALQLSCTRSQPQWGGWGGVWEGWLRVAGEGGWGGGWLGGDGWEGGWEGGWEAGRFRRVAG